MRKRPGVGTETQRGIARTFGRFVVGETQFAEVVVFVVETTVRILVA